MLTLTPFADFFPTSNCLVIQSNRPWQPGSNLENGARPGHLTLSLCNEVWGDMPFAEQCELAAGLQTANTARVGLGKGLKFGFVASSDSHNAFPGAYGEGLRNTVEWMAS